MSLSLEQEFALLIEVAEKDFDAAKKVCNDLSGEKFDALFDYNSNLASRSSIFDDLSDERMTHQLMELTGCDGEGELSATILEAFESIGYESKFK